MTLTLTLTSMHNLYCYKYSNSFNTGKNALPYMYISLRQCILACVTTITYYNNLKNANACLSVHVYVRTCSYKLHGMVGMFGGIKVYK